MERDYKGDGWLGLLRGDDLFADFGGKKPFNSSLNELVRIINIHKQTKDTNAINEIIEEKIESKKVTVVYANNSNVESWGEKEVQDYIERSIGSKKYSSK